MGRLYGLNRDILAGNDIREIAENPRKNEKKTISAISGISQSDIKAISENASISALKAALQAAERSDWALIKQATTEIAPISGL